MMKNALRWFPLFLLFGALAAADDSVLLYPVPEGEATHSDWSVEVNGREAGVLTARTADPPFEKYNYGGVYGFVSLDAAKPVTLKIREKSGRSLEFLTIRPASLGLKPKLNDDGSFDLTVEKPCRFSVEVNGRERPLLIFVNPPEKEIPSPDDPNVIYFGPGRHRPENGVVSLTSGQTLYLAPGAIVDCGVKAEGENITIRGRGIIDGSSWEWRKGPTPHVVSLRDASHVRLEGITIRGASHWTIVPVHCEDVTIENVKLCGGRVQNDDGINPCNSRRVTIRDSFLRTDDDCIAAKGLDVKLGNCEDITVERCVFWCDRARIVLLGHESRAPYMRRIVFRDCDIIHSQGRNFLLEPGEEMKLENLLFEKMRFEIGTPNAAAETSAEDRPKTEGIRFDIDTGAKENWLFVGRPVVNQYMRTQSPGHIADCVIRDITVTGQEAFCGILFSGADTEHRTRGLTIENVSLFGRPLTKNSPALSLGEFLDDVKILPAEE